MPVSAKDENGCTSEEASKEIKFLPNPELSFVNPIDNVCYGDSVTLTVKDTSNQTTFYWMGDKNNTKSTFTKKEMTE